MKIFSSSTKRANLTRRSLANVWVLNWIYEGKLEQPLTTKALRHTERNRKKEKDKRQINIQTDGKINTEMVEENRWIDGETERKYKVKQRQREGNKERDTQTERNR